MNCIHLIDWINTGVLFQNCIAIVCIACSFLHFSKLYLNRATFFVKTLTTFFQKHQSLPFTVLINFILKIWISHEEKFVFWKRCFSFERKKFVFPANELDITRTSLKMQCLFV
jgi:hypothetical protein